jgi:peptidase M28-like protein
MPAPLFLGTVMKRTFPKCTQKVIALLIVISCASQADAAGLKPDAAMRNISPNAIRAHMTFLADDLLEGRGTGTRGYEIAATYVAEQFAALGLEPAGSSGSYFQPVPFRRADLIDSGASASLTGPQGTKKLEYGTDYMFSKDPVHESTRLEAPLVYVGYGVTAPEFNYDDYAGIDVRGKIIVYLRGAPPRFPHNELAYYADTDVKFRNAVERGAVGAMTLRTPRISSRFPWSRFVQSRHLPAMYWMSPEGRVAGAFPEIQVTGTFSETGAAKVFAGAAHPLDEVFEAATASRPLAFDLACSGRFQRKTRHSMVTSPNVAALLPGWDPHLKQETVVVTAHLDHLGIGAVADGDSIYNGAYDNASGVSIMLELAKAVTSLARPPRRSILFLAVTGEEKGLLGSEYYAEYPTVPLENLVADVNLDEFLMLHPFFDVIAFGAEHSSLDRSVRRAAREVQVRVTADPEPEETIFVRSDQYSFVKKGIPSVFLVGGYDAGDGGAHGRELDDAWERNVYHSQKDDMSQHFDFEAGARFARLNFLIVMDVANEQKRPEWNAGDFFGERFGRSRP